MPVAIETVIIIIVVISFAVLFAVVFALYWLWRLLLEDRRCARLGIPRSSNREWPCRQVNGRREQGSQRALLSSRIRHPRITRRNEVIVDERSRRMAPKATPCLVSCPPRPAPPLRIAMEARTPEVIVLDDTEPPPPYEAAI